MDNLEVKSQQQQKKRKEGFEDSSAGEPHVKAPAKKGKSESTTSDSSSSSSLEYDDVDEGIKQTVPMDNPEVQSLQQKKRKEGFEDSRTKAPAKKWKGKAKTTTSDCSSHESDDVNEEIKQTVPMDNPEVESQQQKKRKEVSSAFEESIINFANAMRTIPMEDPEVKSRRKKRKEDFEATDLELVDTSPALDKSQQIIPLYKSYNTPVDHRVFPQGPIVFMHGLSRKVKSPDVENFFEGCGEIRRVRFILSEYQSFEGHGYVEFATVEATHKAVKLNGKSLNGRPVRLLLSGGFTHLQYRSEKYPRD